MAVTGGSSAVNGFAGSGGSSLAPGSSWAALKIPSQVDELEDSEELAKLVIEVEGLKGNLATVTAGLADLRVVVEDLTDKVAGLDDKMTSVTAAVGGLKIMISVRTRSNGNTFQPRSIRNYNA